MREGENTEQSSVNALIRACLLAHNLSPFLFTVIPLPSYVFCGKLFFEVTNMFLAEKKKEKKRRRNFLFPIEIF